MVGMMTQQSGPTPGAPPPPASSVPTASPQPTDDAGGMQANDGGGVSDPQDQKPNVTPEEQQQYNVFVANGLKLIYDKKSLPAVIQRLKGGGDPVEGLASATSTTVMRLQDSAESQGQKIDGDILFHGGVELLQELATLADKAGVHTYTDKELESATYRAMDQYRTVEQQRGNIHQDAAKQDLAQIQQADKSGQLDQQFPGLKEHAMQNAQQQPTSAAGASAPAQQQQGPPGMLSAGAGGR